MLQYFLVLDMTSHVVPLEARINDVSKRNRLLHNACNIHHHFANQLVPNLMFTIAMNIYVDKIYLCVSIQRLEKMGHSEIILNNSN